MDHNEIKLLEWPVIVLCSQVLIIIMIINYNYKMA